MKILIFYYIKNRALRLKDDGRVHGLCNERRGQTDAQI